MLKIQSVEVVTFLKVKAGVQCLGPVIGVCAVGAAFCRGHCRKVVSLGCHTGLCHQRFRTLCNPAKT